MYKMNVKLSTPLLFALAFSLGLMSCAREDETNDHAFQEEREELLSQLEDLRDDMGEQLTELQTRMEHATDEASRENYEEAYEELSGQRNALDRLIADVEHATSETWVTVSRAVSHSYSELRSQFGSWRDDASELLDEVTD